MAVDDDGAVLGAVTWCPVGSPWRQLALADHRAGFGCCRSLHPADGVAWRALVEVPLAQAGQDGMTEVVIWSHPLMFGAHSLYDRLELHPRVLDWQPCQGGVHSGFRLVL